MHFEKLMGSEIWIFKTTGRAARVLEIRSYRDHDVVRFQFCGLPITRETSPRKFLTDFMRLV